MKKLLPLLAVPVLGFALSSCEEKSTSEKVADDVEDAADDVGGAVEDAADDAEDAVDDATDN